MRLRDALHLVVLAVGAHLLGWSLCGAVSWMLPCDYPNCLYAAPNAGILARHKKDVHPDPAVRFANISRPLFQEGLATLGSRPYNSNDESQLVAEDLEIESAVDEGVELEEALFDGLEEQPHLQSQGDQEMAEMPLYDINFEVSPCRSPGGGMHIAGAAFSSVPFLTADFASRLQTSSVVTSCHSRASRT